MEKKIAKILGAGANAKGVIEPVMIEVEASNGVGIHVVGLPDASVKEMLLRVLTAIRSLGYSLPGKIVVNVTPAERYWQGTILDLPIAIGILQACGHINVSEELLARCLFSGELALDAQVRQGYPAYQGYAIAMSTFNFAVQLPMCVLTSRDGAMQAATIPNVLSYGFNHLHDVIKVINKEVDSKPYLIWEGEEWHFAEKGIAIARNQSEYPL